VGCRVVWAHEANALRKERLIWPEVDEDVIDERHPVISKEVNNTHHAASPNTALSTLTLLSPILQIHEVAYPRNTPLPSTEGSCI